MISIEDIEEFMEEHKITKIEIILGSFVVTHQRKKRNEPFIQIHDPEC